MNYKKGDKVKVIGNSTGHCYEIGDVLIVKMEHPDYRDVWLCKKTWLSQLQAFPEKDIEKV